MQRDPLRFVFLLALALVPVSASASSRAFVVTTDFQTGIMGAIDLNTRSVAMDSVSIHSDPLVKWRDGLVYVINRTPKDNIQVVDPANHYVSRQFTTGNGSNPYDIAFVSPTKAYVTRYNKSGLWIMNPATGAFIDEISLTPFADDDGIPDMDHMILLGRLLFVSVQRLTQSVANGASMVVVIDTDTDTFVDADPQTPGVQAIVLQGKNPVTPFAYDVPNRRLLVGCIGAYGSADGGIEAIDPVGLQSRGFVITEAALGGDVTHFVWNGSAHSYAIVSDNSFNTSLVAWSANTHAVLGTVYSPGGFSLADAELNDRGELYVCNNDFFGAYGVYVFSTGNDQLLAGPIVQQLPPFQVCFDQDDPTLAVLPSTPDVMLGSAWPNPARASVRLALTLPRAGALAVDVFDASGRRVRGLEGGARPAGRAEIAWDLRDAHGHAVAPGVYLVRARAGASTFARRVAVVE